MAFNNKATIGRRTAILVALSASQTVPASGEFTELAATRGLEYGPEWETTDTTSRGTGSGQSRTSLVTYKNNNISIDGLTLINDAFQLQVENHIEFPPESMNGQPYAWVQVVEPRENGATRVLTYPCTLTSFRKSSPYDDVVTWTLETGAQGDPDVVIVPAPTP